MNGRPKRILFFLDHAGNLRHYDDPIRLLVRGGHVVRLAFARDARSGSDRLLVERLAAGLPELQIERAPRRGDLDGWRPTSTLIRAAADLARFLHPRFAHAPALRSRAAGMLLDPRRSSPVRSGSGLRGSIETALASLTSERGSRTALRILAACERAIPTSPRLDRFVAAFDPDVVLVTPMVQFASAQADALKSAQALGIATGVCIPSWDNLTTKGLLRFEPDRVFVWNEAQRVELEEQHGIAAERAVTTGAQRFDKWFERQPSRTHAEFLEHAGVDGGGPFVLYTCSTTFVAFDAPDEVSFVRRWLAALREDERFTPGRLGVVVRPHPQNAAPWAGVDLSSFGNAVVWPPGGEHPDTGDARADFFDSLAHAAAVVGINTTAMLEAAIVGKNVLTWLDPAFAGTQEETLHFQHLLREHGGFLRIARSSEEHREQLATALAGGSDELERVRSFVASFVRPHGLDVPAAPILAAGIVELAETPRKPPPSDAPGASVLRAALLVPVALATILSLVRQLRRAGGA
ncbi:MAG: hypothetical protein M3R12_00260 [Actinomycetota bacterium]|nr:hypothetical protein [Actinomycetota bacterium]